jgi:hypothetical protein
MPYPVSGKSQQEGRIFLPPIVALIDANHNSVGFLVWEIFFVTCSSTMLKRASLSQQTIYIPLCGKK